MNCQIKKGGIMTFIGILPQMAPVAPQNSGKPRSTKSIKIEHYDDDEKTYDQDMLMHFEGNTLVKIEYVEKTITKQGDWKGEDIYTYRFFPKGTKEAGQYNYASEVDRYTKQGDGVNHIKYVNEKGKKPEIDDSYSFCSDIFRAGSICKEDSLEEVLYKSTKDFRKDFF